MRSQVKIRQANMPPNTHVPQFPKAGGRGQSIGGGICICKVELAGAKNM